MYTLILEKSSKLIHQARFDNSTGEKMPKEQVLEFYCTDNNLDITLFEVIEIPFTKFGIELGKHIYKDGQFEVSPTWVEPARISTSGIPTTDISTNTTVNG